MIGQKQARIADFLKVVDNELSTTLHTMFVMSPFLGVCMYESILMYLFIYLCIYVYICMYVCMYILMRDDPSG
jgi:hypothetical protein